MKSTKQKSNKAMKIGLISQQKNIHSDSQQLLNQWDLHTNRLNYVQQVITKLQRKIVKLQKSITTAQQIQGEFKDEIGQKIAQMINFISKQQQDNQQKSNSKRVAQTIQSIKQEIKRLNKNNHILDDKFDNIDTRVKKIQNGTNINKKYIENLLDEKINEMQKNMTHQINSNINQVYQIIEGVEIKVKDFKKHIEKVLQKHSLSNQKTYPNNLIDSPHFNNQNYKNPIYNDKSTKTLRNQNKQSIINDQKNQLSNKLEVNQNSNRIFQRKNEPFPSNNTVSSSKNKNTENVPVSQNNSRVVYLRQKLKQFEFINKKYEMKQKQFESNNNSRSSVTSNFSSLKFKSSSKDYSQVSKQESQASRNYYETNSKQIYSQSNKKTITQIQPERISFQRHSSGKKDISVNINPLSLVNANSSLSSGKSSNLNQGSFLNRQQSAKKIDKLKSIRDYLEQTESQIDQSLLEPNFN